MANPLIRFPGRTAVLPPQYLASIGYYAVMAMYPRVVVDSALRFDKRFKSTHRCTVADTRGPLMLTVPVSHVGARSWSDVVVSQHARWWDDHRVSLESAYGRTPFFEFYIDRFLPFLADPGDGLRLVDLDAGLDAVLRGALGIDAEVLPPEALADIDTDTVDRPMTAAKPLVSDVPYYQVRAGRLGFIPGLSVVDLLFNMGTEAPLILMKMQNS